MASAGEMKPSSAIKTTTLLPLLTILTALPLAAQVSTLQIPFTPPGLQVAALGAQISAARTAALQWAAQRGLAAQGRAGRSRA